MNQPNNFSPLSAAVAEAFAPSVYDFDSEVTAETADLKIKNDAGSETGLVITLASPIHPDRMRWEFQLMNRKRQAAMKSNKLINSMAEEDYAVETERLVMCTLGWKGSPTLPYSRANALVLYSTLQYRRIRLQVQTALDEISFFTVSSAPR